MPWILHGTIPIACSHPKCSRCEKVWLTFADVKRVYSMSIQRWLWHWTSFQICIPFSGFSENKLEGEQNRESEGERERERKQYNFKMTNGPQKRNDIERNLYWKWLILNLIVPLENVFIMAFYDKYRTDWYWLISRIAPTTRWLSSDSGSHKLNLAQPCQVQSGEKLGEWIH